MIKILCEEYSQAVCWLYNKFSAELADCDVMVTKDTDSAKQYIKQSIGSNALIVIGNVGQNCTLFADTFDLAMFYDRFAERNIKEYCKLTQTVLPAQHIMDKLCVAPESFIHYACTYCCQCACYGEYAKTHIYMLADNLQECTAVFANYIQKDLLKNTSSEQRYTFKVFGLSQRDLQLRLDKLNKFVSRKCETIDLDSKVVLSFPPKCAKSVVNGALDEFRSLMGDCIYAEHDKTLAQMVVEQMSQSGATVSFAESITGGKIASAVVDVPGASAVLREGIVCYTVQSKCARLGINPHFVDEFGVVSQQVAQEMAVGLRKNGSDIALSITGYAGPTSENGLPVGLCFIGIATQKSVKIFKNIFSGARNEIREQAKNWALFLLLKTLPDITAASNRT